MLVGKRMTPNPITVTPDVTIAEAMDWMRREKIPGVLYIEYSGFPEGGGSDNRLIRDMLAKNEDLFQAVIVEGDDPRFCLYVFKENLGKNGSDRYPQAVSVSGVLPEAY